MNRDELKYMLEDLDVPTNAYSLEGSLLPDCIILHNNYAKWEVFYFDERGNRNNEEIFFSENDACNYIYEYFKKQKEIIKKASGAAELQKTCERSQNKAIEIIYLK
jgi:hypothetical protein